MGGPYRSAHKILIAREEETIRGDARTSHISRRSCGESLRADVGRAYWLNSTQGNELMLKRISVARCSEAFGSRHVRKLEK